MLQSTQYHHFRIALWVCFFLLLATGAFLLIYGKTTSFVLINGYYNRPLDYFFRAITVLGDGIIYVPILVYAIFFNRKFLLPVIFGIIICTIITHFFKRIVFPHELRPVSLQAEQIIIHSVPGVPLNRLHSFPSGHTSTAFSMALLLATIMRHRAWAVALPLIAFFVGYSRIYLAQHFVADVLAGMLIGIITAFLSLELYHFYLKRKGQTVTAD